MSETSSAIDWARLVRAAASARAHAYAPYSSYAVGAAVLTAAGHVYVGCNVENASYGVTLCAERCAIASMVAAGDVDPVAIAIVTAGPKLGPPCGVCRQTLTEFAPDIAIGLALAGQPAPGRVTTLSVLLPDPFRGDLVR